MMEKALAAIEGAGVVGTIASGVLAAGAPSLGHIALCLGGMLFFASVAGLARMESYERGYREDWR